MSEKNIEYNTAKDSLFSEMYQSVSIIRGLLSFSDEGMREYKGITYKECLDYERDFEDGTFKNKCYSKANKEYRRKHRKWMKYPEKASRKVEEYKAFVRENGPSKVVSIENHGVREVSYWYSTSYNADYKVIPLDGNSIENVKIVIGFGNDSTGRKNYVFNQACKDTAAFKGSTLLGWDLEKDYKNYGEELMNLDVYDVMIDGKWMSEVLEDKIPVSVRKTVFKKGYSELTWVKDLSDEDYMPIIRELFDSNYQPLSSFQYDSYDKALQEKYPKITELFSE
ncbi:MAG: hypothetical protein IJ584_08875 [Bacteroidales bacterium]|nr:hypothetical protein [Bacteroidales bacterium]